MRRRFNYFYIILGCFLFSLVPHILVLNANAQDSLKINLDKELKKGNFLIGLKQYLGGKDDIFSKNKIITFSTSNNFLSLESLNGIKHKSKTINILWKTEILEKPYTVERLVVGPFASYESAKKKANYLRQQGHEAIVAYPNNWEVWIPVGTKLSDNTEYKLFHL